MKVTNISNTQEVINKKRNELAKLEQSLAHLPKLNLSGVYKDGLVYGLVYEDGHGNIETLDIMDNLPYRLEDKAKRDSHQFVNGKLYIVGFKPVVIVTEISSEDA